MTVLSDESITTACEQQQPHAWKLGARHPCAAVPSRAATPGGGGHNKRAQPQFRTVSSFLALTRSLSSTAGPGPEHASVCNVRVRGAGSKTPNRLGLSVQAPHPTDPDPSTHSAASCACDSRLAAACWVLLCFARRRESSHGYGTGYLEDVLYVRTPVH